MSFQYVTSYDSAGLRGVDDSSTPRPWNIKDEVAKYAGDRKNLLDVGCGTGFKLLPLAPRFQRIFAVDIIHAMTESASGLFESRGIKNVSCITAASEALPFEDHSFDVISCMLSRFQVGELARVLKVDGTIIAEYPGCEDKKEFKEFFGKDQDGWRGQHIDHSQEDFIRFFQEKFGQFFKNVKIVNGFWNTLYTEEGLLDLLKYTPTVRNFNMNDDAASLAAAIKKFKTASGIRLEQNRVLIYASNY